MSETRRSLVLAAICFLLFSLSVVPPLSACKRCSVGLCIDVQLSGANTCQEVVIYAWNTIVETCELQGSCEGCCGPPVENPV